MKLRARIAVPALALGLALSPAACGSSAAEHSVAVSVSTSSAARDATTATSAARASRGVRLQRIGNFEQPLYLTAAPGDRSRIYVVQRTGQVMLLLNGHEQAAPFLDVSAQITTGFDEQGLLGLAFPADYAKSGLFYVDFTSRRGDIEIVQFHRSAGNPNLADPASAHTLLDDRASDERQPQRRPARVRARRRPLHRRRRRWQRGRSGRQRPEHRHVARQDPADRADRRRRLHDPQRQPVRLSARQARRDLGVWASQPVALLVRSRDRRSARRRRRPGPAGGDRLRRGRQRRRRQLRLEHLGGRPPQQARKRAARRLPGARRPSQRRLLRDHRRLRRARPYAAEPLWPLPVRRLLPPADRVGRAVRRPRRRSEGDGPSGQRDVLVRDRTPQDIST